VTQEEGDWLQLTEEDLARAQQLVQDTSPQSGVLQITGDDVPAAPAPGAVIQVEVPPEAPPPPVRTAATLTITADDLVPAGPQEARTPHVRALEERLFALVNAARSRHLPGWLPNQQLRWHDGLAAVARGHSVDMIKRHYVEHSSPEGAAAADRIGAGGIRFVACGENIGVVYGENSHISQAADDIHNAFMNQPRSLSNHRGNLLNPVWTHIGIGVAYNPEGTLVATQNFISAPGGIAGAGPALPPDTGIDA
jgi:uncharacterized protein YkwD